MKDEKCSTDVTETCGLPARIFNSVLIAMPMQIFACYSREPFLSRCFFIGTLVRQSEINCHFTLLRGA